MNASRLESEPAAGPEGANAAEDEQVVVGGGGGGGGDEDDAFDEGEEGEGEGEDEDEDEDEEESNDASSYTGASELEEEAAYDDQPGCGLSPRLVVRRGVQLLQATDDLGGEPLKSPSAAMPPPGLHRVDTLLGFAHAVGKVDPAGLVATPSATDGAGSSSSSLPCPPLGRMPTLSGLPEVADAFEAVCAAEGGSGSDGAAVGGSSKGAVAESSSAAGLGKLPAPVTTTAQPSSVTRTDTMELLQELEFEEAGGEAGDRTRPAKRLRATAEA